MVNNNFVYKIIRSAVCLTLKVVQYYTLLGKPLVVVIVILLDLVLIPENIDAHHNHDGYWIPWTCYFFKIIFALFYHNDLSQEW